MLSPDSLVLLCVEVTKLALSVSNRVVGRHLLFFQPAYFLWPAVGHTRAVERERVAVQSVRFVSLPLNAGSDSASSSRRRSSSCELVSAMDALLLAGRHDRYED